MVLDQRYFEDLSFWDKLNQSEKKEIIELSNIKKFEKDNIIHTSDGECLGLVKVIEGNIRIYMVSDEGKEVTLYHLLKDEVDVLSASCVVNQITFDTQMVAKEDTNLLMIPVTILAKFMDNNIYVRSYIYEVLADRFSDVMWTMQQILFGKIDQRIATYLIDEMNKHGISFNGISIRS